jgi:hypothetical protein
MSASGEAETLNSIVCEQSGCAMATHFSQRSGTATVWIDGVVSQMIADQISATHDRAPVAWDWSVCRKCSDMTADQGHATNAHRTVIAAEMAISKPN